MSYIRLGADIAINILPYTPSQTVKDIGAICLKGADEGPQIPFSTGGDADKFVLRQKAILLGCAEKATLTAAFKILGNVEEEYPSLIDQKCWTDLNLLAGRKETSLSSVIDRTTTAMGRVFFFTRLARPIHDISRLKRRQALIQALTTTSLGNELKRLFSQTAENEKQLLSFWDGKMQLPGCVNNQYIRYFPETLNKSPLLVELNSGFQNLQKFLSAATQCASTVLFPAYAFALTLPGDTPLFLSEYTKRFIGTSGPIYATASLIPNPVTQGMTALAAGVFAGLTVKSKLKWTRADLSMDAIVHNKVVAAAQHYRTMKATYALLSRHPEFSEHLEHFSKLEAFFEDKSLKALFSILESRTFNGESSFFFRHGNVLVAWDLLQNKTTQQKFEPALVAMGEIDTLLSTQTLLEEKGRVSYCLPEYLKESEVPVLELTDVWNPVVSIDSVVANTMHFPKNAIITGPNGNGKSTALRSLTNACVMAQSLGIVSATRMRFTPFFQIAASINIPDDLTGGKSLFQAQVAFMEMLLTRELANKAFFLNVLDELFTGTSAAQREVLTKKVVEKIGTLPNAISTIVTHDEKMTGLEATGNFQNFHLSKYVMKEGISTEQNAFEVAKALLDLVDQ